MSPVTSRPAAINPLQWPDFEAVGEAAWSAMTRQLAQLGFTAVMLMACDPQSAQRERELLLAAGLEPAPGYWEVPLERGGQLDAQLAAGRTAIDAHASAGVEAIFIAAAMVAEREREPHRYNDATMDEERLRWTAELFDSLGAYGHQQGVAVCVHQHVGTAIQSAHELDAVLEATDPERVLLGPDTGHLAWAGIDPAAALERHGERVRIMHVKDVRGEYAERAERERWTYQQAERGGVWAAPGDGTLDLEKALRAAPATLRWLLAEVDHDPFVTPLESSRRSYAWLAEHWLGSGAGA